MKSIRSNINNKKSITETKTLNSTKSNISQISNEIEKRMTKLETVVAILTNQNEFLMKKIEDIEIKISREKKFSECELENINNKSRSTMNSNNAINCDISCESIDLNDKYNDDSKKEIAIKFEENINENKIIHGKISSLELKNKDVDQYLKSIKNTLEDFNNMKFSFSKKIENNQKIEKIIQDLMNQIKSMKNNNCSWQADFLRNMNTFNEKIMNQEILLDQLENFEKYTTSKIEYILSDIKKIQNFFDNKFNIINEQIEKKENIFQGKLNENLEKIKEFEPILQKQEVNIKALWDSFTFFSHSINTFVN